MRINNNIMAMNTHRQYSVNNNNVAKSTEKLSSGYRINRAGDDAAGLAISEKMRAQIRGLSMASKNSEDAISLVQTAEGALTETHSILQRMRELAVQSSSDTNDGDVDRAALNAEYTALKAEINDIATKTTFNGKKLLDGSFGTTSAIDSTSTIKVGLLGVSSISLSGFSAGTDQEIEFAAGGSANEYSVTFDGTTVTAANTDGAKTISLDFGNGRTATIELSDAAQQDDLTGSSIVFDVTGTGAKIQTGANMGETLDISISSMKKEDIGAINIDGTDYTLDTSSIAAQGDASKAIKIVDDAINDVSTQRANLGALQNRLDHKINNLDTSAENLQAAESRIRDIDMAAEMTNFTKNNILVQASTAMLAQANQAPQNVLSLLK